MLGKVVEPKTKPIRSVKIVSPGPPPEEAIFTGLTDDDWALLLAAWTKDANVEVTGTPPACTGVTGK